MKQHSRKSSLATIAFVCVAVAVLGLSSLLRAQTFEGVVEYSVTTERGTMPMKYMKKGDNVRVEMEGPQGMKATILINEKDNKSVMLMDQMKMYMKMPTPPMGDSTAPKPEITKTGKSQKLLGYDCQQYIVKEGNQATEVWITKDLGPFQMFRMGGPRGQSNAEAWQKAIGNEGGFPLLATTKEGDEQLSKMEATKVEKTSLDDALFKIPDDYKPMDSSMMRRPGQ